MTIEIERRNRQSCEVALNGKYDADWNLCQLPKSQVSKIIAIDGFGLVRDQTRHSEVLDKIITVKDIVGVAGKKRAIVRGKGFGYESLYEVPIGDDMYEYWLDTYKVKPELEGKKSKIKMTNIDMDNETRFFIAVNESALNRWKKKFEP